MYYILGYQPEKAHQLSQLSKTTTRNIMVSTRRRAVQRENGMKYAIGDKIEVSSLLYIDINDGRRTMLGLTGTLKTWRSSV